MKSFFENNSTGDILERIFQIGFEPVCIINEDGFIVKANAAWKNAFGYTPEELENKNFLDFIYAGDMGMTEATMKSSRISIKDYQRINRLICTAFKGHCGYVSGKAKSPSQRYPGRYDHGISQSMYAAHSKEGWGPAFCGNKTVVWNMVREELHLLYFKRYDKTKGNYGKL